MTAYTPTGYVAQVLDGLAQRLDEAGLAKYRRTGAYQPGERGIQFGTAPAASSTSPREHVVLAKYGDESDGLATETTRVQVRAQFVGAHPLAVSDWCDALRGLFPERQHHELGGHAFDRIAIRSSGAETEPDRSDVTVAIINLELRGNRYAA